MTARLNREQQAAVRHLDGPLLVLAGAGSGKTRVITQKIAHLVRSETVPADRIAAVTFTNKAAREMRTRLSGLLGRRNANGPAISTFHMLGLRILRADLAAAGLRPGFSLADPADSLRILGEILRSDTREERMVERVRWSISGWKNAGLEPEQVQPGDDPVERLAARAYPEYARQLAACNSLDLDDLVFVPVRMLAGNEGIRRAWRERIRYLLIDECQDTNAAQYALVRLLTGRRGALTAVGDDDQSIYAWRGAQPENLAQLARDFPNLTVIKLEQNYRSTGRILKAANQVIARNPHLFEKRLWSALGPGDPLRVLRCADEETEAARIVNDLVSDRFRRNGRYGDYAILYRGNHQSRLFERVLRENRIPYYLSGETSFFERAEIRDAMAFLRLLANPDDDQAFLRVVNVPRRGIGPGTLERLATRAQAERCSLLAAVPSVVAELGPRPSKALADFAHWIAARAARADHDPAHELLRVTLADCQYRDWLLETSPDPDTARRREDNLGVLLEWLERIARDGDKDLQGALAELVLGAVLDRDDEDDPGDRVALMTLHAAKGLEFRHVFIAGVEEELLPHREAVASGDVEEERRLFYVGITRAQETLALSLCAQRRRRGASGECQPSRFLDELPPEDLAWEDAVLTDDQRKERAQSQMANLRALLSRS